MLFVGDSLTQGIGRVMWSYREALILKMMEGGNPLAITYLGTNTRPCLIAQPNESYYSRAEVRAGRQPQGRKEWIVVSSSSERRGGGQLGTVDDTDDDYESMLSKRQHFAGGVIPPAVVYHLDRLAAFGVVNTHYQDLGALPLSPLSLTRHEGYCGRTSANVVKGLSEAVSRHDDMAFPVPPTHLNIHIGTNDAVSVARLCKIKESPKFFHQSVEWWSRRGENSINTKRDSSGKYSPSSEYFLSNDFDDVMRTWAAADNSSRGNERAVGVVGRDSSPNNSQPPEGGTGGDHASASSILQNKKEVLKRNGIDLGRSFACARRLLVGSKIPSEDATTPPPTVYNSILGIVAQAIRLHIQHVRKATTSLSTSTSSMNQNQVLNVAIGIPPPLRLPAVEVALEEAVRTACDELNDPQGSHFHHLFINSASLIKVKCVVVALAQYRWVISKDTIDTVHPSYSGAKKLADIWHHTLTVNNFL